MKKKIVSLMFIIAIIIVTFTNVYASTDSFFSLGAFATAYRLSKEADINLPFINVFEKSATYDGNVKHSGISIGQSTIDIDEKLEGVHLIIATDMITIKGEVEHGIISGTNIVVEGKISGDTILLAESVKVLEGAVIENDVVVVADELKVEGTIKGHLIGAVYNATITGTIENDLRLDVYTLSLDAGQVNGDIYVSIPAENREKITGITERYPNAVIKEQTATNNTKIAGEEVANTIFNGAKVVLIYTVFGLIVTKKEKNIASKAEKRFVENSSFGIIAGAAMLMLSLPVIILLIILASVGLGSIAWPILIAYAGLLLLCFSISSFVVGITLYEAIKNKVNKFKIPVLVAIFAVLYASMEIPYIAFYAFVLINLISIAIMMTYIFKREEISMDTVVEAKVVDNGKK